jgi:hypothetical protein
MSEFSESYHLRGTSRRDAIALLERAGLTGYVFPALDGWVTFVAHGKPFELNEHLVAANDGVLVHWVFADDHGWAFDVVKATKPIMKYWCSWEDEIEVEGKISHAELQKALGMELPGLAGEAGVTILYPESIEQLIAVKPAYSFAKAIGLANYRWLAYDYLTRDQERGHPIPAGVQRVE